MPTVGGGPGAGSTLYFKFTSRDSGVPNTLSGSPVVSIYKNSSTTESVAGVTLTTDFDARTGLNHVTVDTSQDTTFYATGNHYDLVITTGTVNGTSVVGEVVGTFDLGTPSTNELIYTNTCPSQAGMTSTQIKFDSGASSTDNQYQFDAVSLVGGTGQGQSRAILSYVGSTRVATVDSAWTTQPDSTTVFSITATTRTQVISYVSGQDPGTLTLAAFAPVNDSVQASPTPTTTAFAGSSALSSTNDFYTKSTVLFTSGALKGLDRKVTSYTGSTRLITVTDAWPSAPSAADTFRFIGYVT